MQSNDKTRKGLSKFSYVILGISVIFLITSFIVLSRASQANKQPAAIQKEVRKDIMIVIDGETIVPTDDDGDAVEPLVVDDTVYLPVRSMCEAVGYDVEWDETTNTVYVYSGWGLGDGEKP